MVAATLLKRHRTLILSLRRFVWLNTKPVTVVGIAPQGFYGDRLATSPPDFYLPISQILALENSQYADVPEARWLHIVGRIKPGVDRGVLQAKLSGQLRQLFAPHKDFSSVYDKPLLARTHVVLNDGGGGVQSMQHDYGSAGLGPHVVACYRPSNEILDRKTSRLTCSYNGQIGHLTRSRTLECSEWQVPERSNRSKMRTEPSPNVATHLRSRQAKVISLTSPILHRWPGRRFWRLIVSLDVSCRYRSERHSATPTQQQRQAETALQLW
jgi:hypothetical protein